MLWEEIKPNMLEKIEDVQQPLEQILEEVGTHLSTISISLPRQKKSAPIPVRLDFCAFWGSGIRTLDF
jgi:hypothetical protein